jgi:hypothetical protein
MFNNWPVVCMAKKQMSATWSSNARRSAILTIALLVALPARGEAAGQDTDVRPPLGALAAQKAATAATRVGQAQGARPATMTITINRVNQQLQITGAATRSPRLLPGGRKTVSSPVAKAPSAGAVTVRVVPYQPIRATPLSIASIQAPSRPTPRGPSASAPRASFAPSRGGSE